MARKKQFNEEDSCFNEEYVKPLNYDGAACSSDRFDSSDDSEDFYDYEETEDMELELGEY